MRMMDNTAIDVEFCEVDGLYYAYYLPTMQCASGRYPRQAIENLYQKIRRDGIGRFPLRERKGFGSTSWQKGDLHR